MGRFVSGGGGAVVTTSTSSNSGSDSGIIDPRKEGLPMFAVWSMYDDQFRYVQCSTYATDGTQTNNPWAYAVYSSPSGDYQGGVMQDKYMGYSGDSQSWYRTSSQISSNSSSYMVGRTQDNTHWPSAASLNIGPTGQFASNIGGSGNTSYGYANHFKYMTTQVLPEGVRPRMFIANQNQYIYRSLKPCHSNGTGSVNFDRLNWYSDSEMQSRFPELSNRRYSTSYGMSGYNEVTGDFVLFMKTSNDHSDMFHWKLRDTLYDTTKTLREIFLNASSFQYRNMDGLYNMSSQDGYYRGVVTIGHNGYCRLSRFGDSQYTTTHLFHLDPSVASGWIGSGSPDSLGNTYGGTSSSYGYRISNTTSYGMDQGNEHTGIQYQSTWDNKWHLHFSQYYYYGAGMSAYVTSVEDPRICYRFEDHNSSYTCTPIAAGVRGWIFGRDQNSDGSDVYYWNFDMAGATTKYDDIATKGRGKMFTYTEIDLDSVGNYNQISATDWSSLVPAHGFYSTNYPRIMNVNWWPTKDGRMQYSGDY